MAKGAEMPDLRQAGGARRSARSAPPAASRSISTAGSRESYRVPAQVVVDEEEDEPTRPARDETPGRRAEDLPVAPLTLVSGVIFLTGRATLDKAVHIH